AVPVARSLQENLCTPDEERAQVAVAALGETTQDRSTTGRDLLRYQTEPGGKVTAFGERGSGANRRHHGAGSDHANPRDSHQPLAARILTGHSCDVPGERLNALVEPPPIARQILDQVDHARRKHVRAMRQKSG